MQFMLMMHAPYGTGDYAYLDWKPEDWKVHAEHLQRLNQELRDAGELVSILGLKPPGQARFVRAGESGEPLVTDGPFPESKEFFAGCWIVEVESVQRACAIAARASAAPGEGGTPLRMTIEVRELMSGPTPKH